MYSLIVTGQSHSILFPFPSARTYALLFFICDASLIRFIGIELYSDISLLQGAGGERFATSQFPLDPSVRHSGFVGRLEG